MRKLLLLLLLAIFAGSPLAMDAQAATTRPVVRSQSQARIIVIKKRHKRHHRRHRRIRHRRIIRHRRALAGAWAHPGQVAPSGRP